MEGLKKHYQINDKQAFEIKIARANKLSENQYELVFFIDFYDFYQQFTISTSKVDDVDKILQDDFPESDDLLLEIVKDELIEEITSEYNNYYAEQKDLEENTLSKLKEFVEEHKNSPSLYQQLMVFIRDKADKYLPAWTSIYTFSLQKNEPNAESYEIDKSFYKNDDNAESFVFLFANNHKDVYKWLEFAWNETHDEKLTEEIFNAKLNSIPRNP